MKSNFWSGPNNWIGPKYFWTCKRTHVLQVVFYKSHNFNILFKNMTDYSTQQCCHAEFLFKLFGNGKQKGPSENY